jgi:hypothetical protein
VLEYTPVESGQASKVAKYFQLVSIPHSCAEVFPT